MLSSLHFKFWQILVFARPGVSFAEIEIIFLILKNEEYIYILYVADKFHQVEIDRKKNREK